MSTQSQKYHLSLAGEFFVAAELQRRGISAAVTYGNAKNADVVAFTSSGKSAVIIEVKSTSQKQWVVGNRVPAPSTAPWVFVYLPIDPLDAAPRYFVLLQSELHNILAPKEAEYFRKYKEKHGVKTGEPQCVWNLTRKQAEGFESDWGKIINQISTY